MLIQRRGFSLTLSGCFTAFNRNLRAYKRHQTLIPFPEVLLVNPLSFWLTLVLLCGELFIELLKDTMMAIYRL